MSNQPITPNYRAKKNLRDLADLNLSQGDILYYDGTNLTKLPAGTSGQFLKTQGTGANPVWATVGGSGTGDVTGPASSTDNAIARFDGTGGKTIQNSQVVIDDSGNLNIPAGAIYQIDGSQISGGDVLVNVISGATYTDIQDWLNTTQSAGKISGGDFTDNGDGTIDVAAGTGFIKTSNSDTAETKFFDWSAVSSLSLTDNATNYIYVEYNSGSPQVVANTSIPSDKNTNVLLGLVYREGTSVHIVEAGQEISNYAKKTLWKDIDINGKLQYVSGLKISESGTRNIKITSGYIYAGLSKKSLSALDTSGSDTFTLYYRDGSGGWTKSTGETQVDNQYYDDNSGTLASLSTDYFANRWVYMDVDGHLYVVMGQNQYSFARNAYKEEQPASLPQILTDISFLVGKITVKQGKTSFKRVVSPFENVVNFAEVTDHNDLSGLQGGTTDEYYHLTSSQYTEATQYASGSQNGLLKSADWTTFNNKLSNVVDDTSPQLGGDLDANSKKITNIKLATYSGIYDNGNSGTSKTIDWNNGNEQKITLTDNVTLTFTAPSSGYGKFTLIIDQDSTGGRTVTFPSSVKWAGGGTAPTITSDANARDIVTFLYDGTYYNGTISQDFS